MNVTKKNQHCSIKKHWKLNTGMIGVKSFEKEQILLAKNALKDEFCKSTKLHETSNKKHSVDEVRQLTKEKIETE